MAAESYTHAEFEMLRAYVAVGFGGGATDEDPREEITKAYDFFSRLISRVNASRAVAAFQPPTPNT